MYTLVVGLHRSLFHLIIAAGFSKIMSLVSILDLLTKNTSEHGHTA